MSRARPMALVALSLFLACSDAFIAPDVLQPPGDPALLARSIAIEIDLVSSTARARNPTASTQLAGGLRPDFALLGGNEIGVVLGNLTRTPLSTRDEVFLDVSIVNKLLNVDLTNPTFPAPPHTQGIFLAPFAATVSSGYGNVRANAGSWLRTNPPDAPERWNFFNDAGCPRGNNDCLVYATLPTLDAGATSPAVRVSFLADRTVQAFTVYMIVAADLHERPVSSGTVSGTVIDVTSQDPLAGLQVSITSSAGTTSVITDATGYYSATIAAGDFAVSVASVPAYCTAPANVGGNVAAGGSATVSFRVTCLPGPVINSASLPSARVGLSYSAQLNGTPATGQWSQGSTMPSGLVLSHYGVVSGMPTGAGSTQFTVRLSDAHGRSATRQIALWIDAALPRDPHEPNETIAQSDNLGAIYDGGTIVTSGWFHDDQDKDFFWVDLRESGGICLPFTPEEFYVTFHLVVGSISDYDLYVYDGNSHHVLGSSTSLGTSSEYVLVRRSGICGTDDSFSLHVEVKRYFGVPTTLPYTLTISMWEN